MVFRDMMGKEIKVGQTVLYLWIGSHNDPDSEGEKFAPIKHRTAKIIKINEKSVRIQCKKRYSNIRSTRKFIIMINVNTDLGNDIEERFELMDFE